MNEHTLRVLEYDKIKEVVAANAASGPGRAAVAEALPSPDRRIVEQRLRETRECLQILQAGGRVPLDGIKDIRSSAARLKVAGSVLAPAELLDIALTLAAGRRVKSFFEKLQARGGVPAAPALASHAARIQPLQGIEEAVRTAVDEKAGVKDAASPELRRVRKLLARTREEILGRLERILQDGSARNVVQEPVVTIRDDRYVIPLKPNFRQSLKGVVHGQSGSRATLFVEPLDVLEQNNRLAELRMDERAEVERILRELTSAVAKEAPGIEETVDALAAIDAIYARAAFGMHYGGTVPEVSSDGAVRLREARHPLLVGKKKSAPSGAEVTPNNVDLGGPERVLIISGPNAGGKTVILKTLGLLCLMAQSGMPVTAAEGSVLPVFGSVFADIGDEQSLEQSLSTFSSHISTIAGILRQTDGDALVLLDELGAGTDPAEGSALGAAVLEALLARGSMTVVTTHHSGLKLFGSRTAGAKNGAMEFDPGTLTPTYRLLPGRPGRSYGLDMAARLGVPGDVVQAARSRLSQDDKDLDRLLEQLEEDARRLRQERREAEKERTFSASQVREAEILFRTAQDEAREIKTKARQEARDVLASLRRKLRDLSRAAVLDKSDAKQEDAEIESLARRLEPEERGSDVFPAGLIQELHPGDRVRIPRIKKTGTVLTTHKNVLEVDAGGVKLKLSASEVLPAEASRRAEERPAAGWGAELQEIEGLPDRLNIIGNRAAEAEAEVDRFIDRAAIAGLSSVIIIHGTGTGALKAVVAERLKGHPLVAAVRPGKPAEGGAGVTIAELKR